jgi:hypothetical protein
VSAATLGGLIDTLVAALQAAGSRLFSSCTLFHVVPPTRPRRGQKDAGGADGLVEVNQLTALLRLARSTN